MLTITTNLQHVFINKSLHSQILQPQVPLGVNMLMYCQWPPAKHMEYVFLRILARYLSEASCENCANEINSAQLRMIEI